jgi:hypothetical protein
METLNARDMQPTRAALLLPNLLLQQPQLMLLNLNLARALPPFIPRRTARRPLMLKHRKCPPSGRHAFLSSAQLLRTHEDPRPARRRAPDIVSPSSFTLCVPTSRENVTACVEAASSQIIVSLKTNVIVSATSSA